MRKRTWRQLLLVFVVFSLLAAACGDDDDGGDSASGDDTSSGDDSSGDGDGAPASLADVCPSPLVIQTDWFPEAEHGALYNLIGDGYTVDVGNKVVSGPMIGSGGAELGIDFEVRTGGPAIGFAPVSSHMYTDDSIHLGYGTTDGQALRFEDAPLLSVVAPLEKNPQMIMWDPDAHPDVNTIADLGDKGVTINIFGGGTFADVFVAQGIWSADQVDPSYDGSPARFVSEGNIAQQGFASAEVYTYENVFEEWGKPVEFQLLHDTGFEVYSQTVAIRPDDQADLDACLTQVVPIIQQSVVDYAASPGHANDIIVDAVEQYADFWVYDLALADFSVSTQVELGLVGNGPDATVGNMDAARVQSVLDQLLAAEMDLPADIGPDDIFTNEYIDSSIGFAGGASDDGDSGDEAAASLADVCPSPLVVQTDWFPEAEHGAMYNLIGDGYTVDVGNKVVSGPMIGSGGAELGIDFEVRTGGPAIGFAPVASHMYTDDSIHLGYGTTDGQILRLEATPLLSVVAPLEKNPQIIMWDPDAHPNVDTIADLGTEGVTINIFGGGTFADVFVAQGIWSADQVDPSYDGSPARFVSEGNIAQQGFASAEPYTYENVFEEWGKPVEFQLLHDTGFEVYSQTVAIRPDDQADLDACLTQVVPIIQQSVVDYAASPGHANDIIVDAVEQYADFWVYDLALADFSINTQVELGLVSNGSDGTVGNMDEARIQSIIDQLAQAGMDFPADVTPADIYTNEYIDDSIGF